MRIQMSYRSCGSSDGSDELQKRFQITEEGYGACCQEFFEILSEDERESFVRIVGRLAAYSKEHFETEKDGGLGE